MGLVFSISNFISSKIYPANRLSVFSCSNSALTFKKGKSQSLIYIIPFLDIFYVSRYIKGQKKSLVKQHINSHDS